MTNRRWIGIGLTAILVAGLLLDRTAAGGPRTPRRLPSPPRPAAIRAAPLPSISPSEKAAIGFAQAVWTYDWRLGAPGVVAAVARWATPDLIAELRAAPGAPAFEQSRQAAREVDTVAGPSAATEDTSPTGVGYAVSAVVTVSQVGRARATARRYLDVLVRLGPAGWRAAQVDA